MPLRAARRMDWRMRHGNARPRRLRACVPFFSTHAICRAICAKEITQSFHCLRKELRLMSALHYVDFTGVARRAAAQPERARSVSSAIQRARLCRLSPRCHAAAIPAHGCPPRPFIRFPRFCSPACLPPPARRSAEAGRREKKVAILRI